MNRVAQRNGRHARALKNPDKVLVVDIGGTNVKLMATGHDDTRKVPSGRMLTPQEMVKEVLGATNDWDYQAVAVGFPGLVDVNGPAREPRNLGEGWVGFDFATAFGKPVRIINDAAMQALGSYEGGRMLFLGLGTAIGSTFISERVIVPLELGCLPYCDDKPIVHFLGKQGRKRIGHERWEHAVKTVVGFLQEAFAVDYLVLGGGNAKKIKDVPPGVRVGGNENAFLGGYRLWNLDLPVVKHVEPAAEEPKRRQEWRVV